MTWKETDHMGLYVLPQGEKVFEFRFVENPGQGVTEDWSSSLKDRLTRLGNPVRVRFDCWRQFGGDPLGFNIDAIGGEPYFPAINVKNTHSAAFSDGLERPDVLGSAFSAGK